MISTLRQVLRSLSQSPAFTFTVLTTLAIGIGLNAAIFTVVDNILLRPLGYHDADRIVAVRTHFNDENRSIPRLAGDDYVDLAREVHGLQATAQYQGADDGFAMNGTSLYVPVGTVSSAFTEVMGVQPLAGRVFRSNDSNGSDALLSAAFVRNHFASPAAAIGQSLHYGGRLYTVVGVLPEGFSFPGKTDAWFETPVVPGNRTSYSNRVLAKRRAGVSEAQLEAELATFSAGLRRVYSEDAKKSIEAVPLQEELVGRIRPTLRLLMGSVAIILLIVCANVTHLQLVRATRQVRAITICTALGASRTDLALRALAETLLLALGGSALALLLAVPTLQLLGRLAPQDVPRLTDVHLNFDVFLFSVLVSVTLMVLSALLPVWRSWQVDPASALRADASRGTETRGALRLRSGFIVAEVALTLMLSVAAVLLTRQLIAQSRAELGFSPDSLLTLDAHAVVPVVTHATVNVKITTTPMQNAEEEARQLASLVRLDTTIASIAAVPGVDAAAAIGGAPMGFGGSDVGYAIRGRQSFPSMGKLPDAEIRPVSPGFFATMGIPLLKGRLLSANDRNDTPSVLLISKELAQQEFPNQNPLGQQIMCGYDERAGWWTIVGVVGDIRAESPAAPPLPTFYVPIAQHRERAADMQFVVRTKGDPAAMGDTLRKMLANSHPELAVKATTMRQNVSAMQRGNRFRTTLFLLFAAVSILLAAIGMYGVTAYTVAQRRFEFGLRFALGASREQVLSMVLRKALLVTSVGIAVGVVLSLVVSKLVAGLVGTLPAFDLPAYAFAILGVLLVAIVATLMPARRASLVEPMTVLRSE